MNIKNNLLTKELLDQLNDNHLEVYLELSATSCCGRWPMCRIYIDNQIKFDGEIRESQIIKTTAQVLGDHATLAIETYGKTDKDTVVDENRKISENMTLHIKRCKINGANIVDSGYIRLGKYKMDLNDAKRKYYEDHKFPLENHDYHFYENGVWTIEFSVPILKGIIKKVRTLETYETIPYQKTLEEIYKRIS